MEQKTKLWPSIGANIDLSKSLSSVQKKNAWLEF